MSDVLCDDDNRICAYGVYTTDVLCIGHFVCSIYFHRNVFSYISMSVLCRRDLRILWIFVHDVGERSISVNLSCHNNDKKKR